MPPLRGHNSAPPSPTRAPLSSPPRRAAIPRAHLARERGTALVAVLIAIIILQLAVLSVVTLGAQDQDLTADRVNGARAFYAAEAGANMAIREWMTNTDADNDGGIGTISNDNNENNDPALDSARFYVTSSSASGSTILTVRARCGTAVRQIEVAVGGGT